MQQYRRKFRVKANSGEIHEVWKLVLSGDGEESVWCNSWDGHHRIGLDCEWYEEPVSAPSEPAELLNDLTDMYTQLCAYDDHGFVSDKYEQKFKRLKAALYPELPVFAPFFEKHGVEQVLINGIEKMISLLEGNASPEGHHATTIGRESIEKFKKSKTAASFQLSEQQEKLSMIDKEVDGLLASETDESIIAFMEKNKPQSEGGLQWVKPVDADTIPPLNGHPVLTELFDGIYQEIERKGHRSEEEWWKLNVRRWLCQPIISPSTANTEEGAEPAFHVRAETVEEEWNNFWKGTVCNPDGSINIEQVKKELADFSFVISQVPKVYCHITGSLLSNVMYLAETVIAKADEYYEQSYELDRESDREDLKEQQIVHAEKFHYWKRGRFCENVVGGKFCRCSKPNADETEWFTFRQVYELFLTETKQQ